MGEAANARLALALAEAGLIQFGRFAQSEGGYAPVALRLRWLPSYPALLRQVAVALHALSADLEVDRLLAAPDALPVAVALGLHANWPVTYLYGAANNTTAAQAIEGAYDVGHPTLLLANELAGVAATRNLMRLARQVGLDVHTVLAVVDFEVGAADALRAQGIGVHCALALRAVLPLLETHGVLPAGMRHTVERWLDDGGLALGERDGGSGPAAPG